MSLPGQLELAKIVYAESGGIRAAAGETIPSPVVREHWLAIAVIVVNRARQGMNWGDGQGTMWPVGPTAGALRLPGTPEAWAMCQEVAREALLYAACPLDDWMIWEGAQFYRHRWGGIASRMWNSGPSEYTAQFYESVPPPSITPPWDPRPGKRRGVWLDIYLYERRRD